MRKILRLPLLLLIVLIAAVLFFSWKIDFLAAPVRLALHKATGDSVRIGRVEYRLFNRITLRDVELGDYFRCRNVTLSLDPVRILLSPRHPQDALTHIHFSRPGIVITPSFLSMVKKIGTSQEKSRSSSRITFSLENAVMVMGKYRVDNINGRIVAGTSSGGAIAAVSGSHHFSVRFQSRAERSQTTGFARIKVTGPGTRIETAVDFIRRADGVLTTTAAIDQFSWKNITADHSTFRLNSSPKNFSFVLNTPGGSCTARGPSADTFAGRASFQLASLVKTSSGTASADFKVQHGALNSAIHLADTRYGTRELGSLNMTLNGAAGKAWHGEGDLLPSGYRFNADISPSLALSVFLEKGKGSGMLMGQLKPLSMDISVTDWPVDNAPFLSSLFPSLKGSLSIEGSLSPHDTRIQARGTGWETTGSSRSDWTASVYQTDGTWFLKSVTHDQSVQFNARRFSNGQWDVSAALHHLPLHDVMAWGGQSARVSGTVSSDIFYSSQGNGKARVSAANVLWPGGGADSALLDFLITPDKASLVSCTIRSPGGSVTGRGAIDRDPDKPHAFSLDLLFKDFPVQGHPANGTLECNGTLISGIADYCEGTLTGNRLSWGPWTANRLTVPFIADDRRVDLKNIRGDRMVRGNIALTRHDRVLSGELILAGIPLENFSLPIKGQLSGKLAISGPLSQPSLRCDYSAQSLQYRDISGKANGIVFWQKGTLSTPRSILSIGAGSVALNGTFWPALSATANIKDIPLSAVRAAGIQQDSFKGVLSGSVQARGPLNDPEFAATISGHGLSVGSMIVNDLSARFNEKKGTITIDTFSAKSGDAELCILQGSSVDIIKHTFAVRSDWRNIDTGPAVLFGALSFSGAWDNGKDRAPVVTGSLTTDNFWINEHHLETTVIGMRYSGRSILFEPGTNQPFSLTGTVDFSQRGSVSLRNLTFSRDDRTVKVQGAVGAKKWDLTLTARKADASTLGEILDLPVSLTGNIDADITGRGSLNAPELHVALSVTDGSIEDLPFDALIVKGAARNDILTLEEVRMTRLNQFAAIAHGTAPFYLTSETKKRVMDRPLDLSLRIEQGTLNLLTALTSDIKSGTGKLNAQAHLTGTLTHPLANGYVKVNNGELTGRRYFSRITDMDVDLEWKDTILTVKTLSGKIGPGRLNVTGTIEFDGFLPSRYDLSFQTEGRKGIAISIPELPIPSTLLKTQDWDLITNLSHGVPRVNVRFSGPAQNPVLSGSVELEDTRFTYPSVAKHRDGESFFDPLWPKMSWDIELHSGKNTWYDNELVSVLIQGGIRFSGRGLKPTVSGKVEAIHGTINYLGTEFKIKQAQLEIVKEMAYLEGEASADVADTKMAGQTDTIEMFIDKSEIGKITPRFVSKGDPELSPEQALARATGINPERYSSTDRDYMLRQQLVRLFDATLTTPLARNLLRKSGLVDTFRVQYLSQEPIKPLNPGSPTLTELLYGTKYSLEKYLTTQMLFGYSMTFDQLQNKLDLRHELELSYQLNRTLFLRGSYELDTSNNPFRQYDRRITLEQQFRFDFAGRKKKPVK